MRPPADFVRQLRDFDPELRVRWAKHIGCWFIEMRARELQPAFLKERPNPLGDSARAKDLWLGWIDGYLHVVSVHPTLLRWEHVYPVLDSVRIEDRRKVEELNRMLDEANDEWDAGADRARRNLNEIGASEMYDAFAWSFKRRVATYIPADPLTRLEQHDGFRVTDRRRSV